MKLSENTYLYNYVSHQQDFSSLLCLLLKGGVSVTVEHGVYGISAMETQNRSYCILLNHNYGSEYVLK